VKRILVTGGAGFIGSHVVARLLALGHRVRVLDDLSTGIASQVGDAELVVGDVSDDTLLAQVVRDVDAVVHLAAVASVVRSVEGPLDTQRVNLRGTLALLEAMRCAGVTTIAFASSAAVYGPIERPHHAEHDAIAPGSPYAVEKAASELYLRTYVELHGFDARALRFFNVYGPRQRSDSPYSGVISLFAAGIGAGRPITIFGDGEQTRDFVYVGDVAEVVVRSIEAPAGSGFTCMNVCAGRGTSLQQLVHELEAVTLRTARVERAPARPGDIRHSRGDARRLRTFVDVDAFTPLDRGLAATVQWLLAPGHPPS
jgi:UDP-glucose 4-epimerase